MTEWRIDLRERCARCGHVFSFHSKAMDVPCKAMGCKGGEDEQCCPGFEVEVGLSATW